MKFPPLPIRAAVLLATALAGPLRAAEPTDPLLPFLDGKPPEILQELPPEGEVPGNVKLQRVVFRSRGESRIFAAIARPTAPGKYPGILVLHGGGGSAEVDKAIAWAQRGYVAVAPDLPGIADPKKLRDTTGPWSALEYGHGRWVADPDGSASVIFDAVVAALNALDLLRAQPDVDPSRIGVVGISWGGYMTTMICGLAGDRVKAGFSVFGCGFYEYTSQLNGPKSTLGSMPEVQRERWLKDLDAGRRASGIRASFFVAGATNDFFFWPQAVQATLDAIPGEKNHLYAPNANHKVPLPGGMEFPKQEPFVPTAFQPYPTPGGNRANWLAMEVPFFDYHLKGTGDPLPRVSVDPRSTRTEAVCRITSPRPLAKVEVYWAKADPDVKSRQWLAVPATESADGTYRAALPEGAADWFVVASDDRPVTVSSDMVHVPADSKPTYENHP